MFRVPTAQGKQGKPEKWPKIFPVREKHREFGNFVKTQGICQNTGKTQNYFCSSGKCSDSKSTGHWDICCKKRIFFSRSWIGLPSQFCVCNRLVTNYVNWHRENLRSDREKTGKTQGI